MRRDIAGLGGIWRDMAENGGIFCGMRRNEAESRGVPCGGGTYLNERKSNKNEESSGTDEDSSDEDYEGHESSQLSTPSRSREN